uniref:Uncharacterized protein n=1 Tax=Sinocyclocheilus rhinocerous TaxID=307959 RepID=A0A673I2Z9_9TELE
MANESPAKSLVDIDLASLRVSAAGPFVCSCRASRALSGCINHCGALLCDCRTLLAFLSWWKWSAMAPTDKYTRSVSFESYSIYNHLPSILENTRFSFRTRNEKAK